MIDSFTGRYWFLSNFYPSPITLGGKLFPTVEHAFQSLKTLDSEDQEKIRLAETPALAKKMGRNVEMRKDWEAIKLDVMRGLLTLKFEPRDSELARKLIATYPQNLVEGNTWGDTYWGICNGRGENHLGRLLMKIREGMVDVPSPSSTI